MTKIKLGETIARVLWEDAWTDDGYFSVEDTTRASPFLIKSTGYVLRYDKHCIVLGREQMKDEDRYRKIQYIPRPYIRKVDILNGPRS